MDEKFKFFAENEKSTNPVHYFKCILINIHDEVCKYMHENTAAYSR